MMAFFGREPLQHKAFRWLLGGRSLSYLGNAVAPVALAFAVLDLTGSVSDLGLVVGARSVTNVALLLFGGVLADRLPRALVLRGSAAAAALTQALVAALVLTGTATIPLLMVLGALNGAVAAMALPASAALTPQTVPAHLIRPANALLRLVTNSALMGGAAAGGLLVAVVGPGWGIAVDAATFGLSAWCFAHVRVPEVSARTLAEGPRSNPLTELREGWAEFRSRTWVWVVVLQAMVVNAVYAGGVVVLGPAVADSTFGRGGWGLVMAASTAGMVAGGVLAMRWQPHRALAVGVGLTGLLAVPFLLLANAPRLLPMMLGMFLAGVGLEQFGVAWDVSLQQHVPTERLARVYSYDAVGSFVAIPVGEVAAGPVAQQLGIPVSLTAGAAVIVVVTAAALSSASIRGLTRQPPGVLEAGPAA